jgi:hypothetical protein
MKTFKIRLYIDMRVVVQQRSAETWQVWPQRFRDGEWTDHAGEAVAIEQSRAKAMLKALKFCQTLITNVEGPWAFR